MCHTNFANFANVWFENKFFMVEILLLRGDRKRGKLKSLEYMKASNVRHTGNTTWVLCYSIILELCCRQY